MRRPAFWGGFYTAYACCSPWGDTWGALQATINLGPHQLTSGEKERVAHEEGA